MLKSEKIESGAAWSLPGLTARTVGNRSMPLWLSVIVFTFGLMTVVPVYYMGAWMFFTHGAHRKRLAKFERHKELLNAVGKD